MNQRIEFILILAFCLVMVGYATKKERPRNICDEKRETAFVVANCPHIDETYPAFFPREIWPSHAQLIDYENRVVALEQHLLSTTGNPYRILIHQPIGPNGINMEVFDDSTGFYIEMQNPSFAHIESLIRSIDFKALNSRGCAPFEPTPKHFDVLETMSGEISRLCYGESGIDWHVQPTIDSCGRIMFSFFKPDEFIESMAFVNVDIGTLVNAILDFPIRELSSKE